MKIFNVYCSNVQQFLCHKNLFCGRFSFKFALRKKFNPWSRFWTRYNLSDVRNWDTFKGWLDFNQPSCHKCLMHFIFDKSWRSPDLRKQCNLFAGKQYVVLFPPAGRFLQGCTYRDQSCVAPL